MTAPDTLPVVLVVDDEPELRALLAECFGRHGFEVRARRRDARRWRAALARLSSCLTWAILDVNMPGENGLSLALPARVAAPGPGGC